MSSQAVPWAEGRRALVRQVFLDGVGDWQEAVGSSFTRDGEIVKVWDVLDGEGDIRNRLEVRHAETAHLPDQCASCHELVRHAEGCSDGSRCGWACPHGDRCRLFEGHDGGCNHGGCPCNEANVRAGLSPEEVAANLARGVPAFWAPWAMWTYPSGDLQAASEVEILALWPKHGQTFRINAWKVKEGTVSNAALVALGPEGPTLAPWIHR